VGAGADQRDVEPVACGGVVEGLPQRGGREMPVRVEDAEPDDREPGEERDAAVNGVGVAP
jgi:hypothetical protein